MKKIEVRTRKDRDNCYTANGFLYCFCGKCKAIDINETHIACVEDEDDLYEGKFIDKVRSILKTNIK